RDSYPGLVDLDLHSPDAASHSLWSSPRDRRSHAGGIPLLLKLRPVAAAIKRYFRLLNPDRIATADGTPLRDGSIHTDVDLVMLGGRAQDSRVFREIPLRESRHHATPARTGDVQAHRGPDRERSEEHTSELQS